MFDHVLIAVSDLAASERFYRSVLSGLGYEPNHVDPEWVEWEDLDVIATNPTHPVTTGLHIGIRARAAAELGVDPDGNRIEAVGCATPPRDEGCIDHVRLRVRDLAAARDFYATIAPFASLQLTVDEPDRVQFQGPDFALWLVADGAPTTPIHIAFAAATDAAVRDFHNAALAAGYTDNGAPGERLKYHPGYYGAFVLDPDGHNIEAVNHNRS